MSEESERVKYLLKYWSHLQLAREYEQLENIIKEIKEYVSEIIIDETYTKCILEILDKENK